MTSFIAKISDLIRSLSASLQLSNMLPSLALTGGFIGLNQLQVTSSDYWSLILLSVILTIAFLFYALNMPLIRLYEGYILNDSPLAENLYAHQYNKIRRHLDRINIREDIIRQIKIARSGLLYEQTEDTQLLKSMDEWVSEWNDEINHEKERLADRFPPDPNRILPTSFGNTIAAFEAYPNERYNIDIATLWTRFVPTLMERDYAKYIESEKMTLDFFVNMLTVCIILWLTALFQFAYSGFHIAFWAIIAIPVASYILYKGACVAAENWGCTVKASFDLYRYDLCKALNLKTPSQHYMNLEEERKMWLEISKFLARGDTNAFDGFNYYRLK